MTTIAAVTASGSTWFGWNSHATIGDTPVAGNEPWISLGNWWVEVSGSSAQFDRIIRNTRELSIELNDAHDVVALLESVLDPVSDDDGEETYGIWSILIKDSSQLWDLDSSFALSAIPEGRIWSRGSGMDYALGAGFAAMHCGKRPEEALSIAIEAGISHDIWSPGASQVRKFD